MLENRNWTRKVVLTIDSVQVMVKTCQIPVHDCRISHFSSPHLFAVNHITFTYHMGMSDATFNHIPILEAMIGKPLPVRTHSTTWILFCRVLHNKHCMHTQREVSILNIVGWQHFKRICSYKSLSANIQLVNPFSFEKLH